MGRSTPPRSWDSDDASDVIRYSVEPWQPPPEEANDPIGTPPVRHDVVLDEAHVDPDVRKVVRRLTQQGYEAFLVGGCVRDLLLGMKPKDFDVATSARPEQVRAVFRNSRIIGRRFRLVHVLFHGGKVIEVATFRRNPNENAVEDEGAELLIRSDNVFGTASEDAERRDFTINALFYDIAAGQILDWKGGLEHLRKRVVQTIGDPEVRFREDPIRILRALKFAGRLDLGIAPEVYEAIVATRDALTLAAKPRVGEEIMRLLRGGQARRTIYLALETGVLDVLLPELSTLLYDVAASGDEGHRFWRLLAYMDRQTQESGPMDDIILWTLLLLEPMKEACEGTRDRGRAVTEFLAPLMDRLALSRRVMDGMRRIVAVLPRLSAGKAGRMARSDVFPLALEVAIAEQVASGKSPEALLRFRQPPSSRRRGSDYRGRR